MRQVGLEIVLICAYNADLLGKKLRAMNENIEEAIVVARQDYLEVKEQ